MLAKSILRWRRTINQTIKQEDCVNAIQKTLTLVKKRVDAP